MSGLRTREPSGQASWPSLIVEGREGAGKTHACLTLSADPRIGRTFVVEVGEKRADEYAALGDFVLVDHDGTLPDIVGQIHEVLAQPPVEGRPNVLVIDSATQLWDLCKRQVDHDARQTKRAREILRGDPDADIDAGHAIWNKVTDRWWWGWLDHAARGWPGLLLLTARSEDVSKFVDGRPVPNQKEYRVDIQKGTPFAVTGTVRMRLGQPPLLTTVKSLKVPQLPPQGLEVADLATLIFDTLGAGTAVDLTVPGAKAALVAHARALGMGQDDAVAAAGEAWGMVVTDETSFDGVLMRRLTDAVELVAAREAVPA